MRFMLAVALLFAPASLCADILNYTWTAEVSSGGTCQPYCGPFGFDVHNGDWISGTFSLTAPGQGWQAGTGEFNAVIGSSRIGGPATFVVHGIMGTPMVLMYGPEESYAWLHPVLGSGCGIYGCPQFPTDFDEIVFEVRTNHGPDLDPLDWGPPQTRYLNAWCSNSARCVQDPPMAAAVPEPSTIALIGGGLVLLIHRRYR